MPWLVRVGVKGKEGGRGARACVSECVHVCL